MRFSIPSALLLLAPLAVAQQSGDVSRLTGATERVNTPAQPKPESASDEASMSADELEDIGPLRVLSVMPAHRWFEAGASAQLMFTDNVALLESKTSGDVGVVGAFLGVNAKPMEFAGGRLGLGIRYDYAAFGYGLLSDRRDHAIAGSVRRLKDLDFQSHALAAEAEWRRGDWSATTGLRGAAYYGTRSGDREYSEIAPYLRVAHTWELTSRDYLAVGGECDYRFTNTPLPAGFSDILGNDLNDRFDLAVSFAYTRLIGEHWFAQAAWRLNYARYTQGGSTPGDAGAGAETWTHTIQLAAGYAPNAWLTARVFTSFEARDATEDTTPDYRVANLGLGASVTARF